MAYADLDSIQNPTAANYPLAIWGAQINDNFDAMWPQMWDGWISWSPAYANFSAGAGSTTQAYRRIGYTVEFQIQVDFGAGMAITGTPTFALPVTPNATYMTHGDGVAKDDSASAFYGLSWVADAGSGTAAILIAGSGTRTGVSSSSPFTAAAGDSWVLRGLYRAASATSGQLS